jgi:hypothetical protein
VGDGVVARVALTLTLPLTDGVVAGLPLGDAPALSVDVGESEGAGAVDALGDALGVPGVLGVPDGELGAEYAMEAVGVDDSDGEPVGVGDAEGDAPVDSVPVADGVGAPLGVAVGVGGAYTHVSPYVPPAPP